ncbi:MAG: DUF1385 domain-containing protein [Fusobacteriaceae bacterium]
MSRINVGGQAVIEGVMMRGPSCLATAVRKKTGEIVYKKTEISNKKNRLLKIPMLRGGVMLFDSLVLGVKELTFSANHSEDSQEEQLNEREAILTALFSIGLGILLFVVLPSLLSNIIFSENRVYSNLMEGGLRLVFFLLYIWLISFSKDIKRVFQYHGAEHKAIYNYEGGEELTIENSQKYTTLHPRCGTSFLLIVMLTSILFFAGLDFILPVPSTLTQKLLMRVGLRILFMPLIAGISYEVQRYSSRHLDNPLVKLLASPGLSLQKITTQEPDDTQVEVAIVALKAAIGEPVNNAREVTE